MQAWERFRGIVAVALLSAIISTATAKYSGGSGTADDPYQIATAVDLIALGETPEDYDKHCILTADIDLDPNLPGRKTFDKAVIAPNTDPANEGYEGMPFNGVFDGKGHKISHLTIVGESCLGLFGQMERGAEIRNLGLVDTNVTASGEGAGGLVGRNDGSIAASYSTGPISGNLSVGGLVGSNHGGSITASYSSGVISGPTENKGGLIGHNDQGSISASFWDIQTSGKRTSAGGMGLTTTEMQTASTFLDAGWDLAGETANGTEDIW